MLNQSSKTELLSPAKDKNTAKEAINCGADAVYIGATAFGARQNAGNSIEDIQETVNYAHKFWAKVFVTVNTILTDEELNDAVELIKTLDKIGVDAVLVQDMGLLNRLIELENNSEISVPIHMSTQCDNRLPEKISFFNKIGVSRVVLARELSLKQIKEIHEKNPELELEAFVHGALCVSYSGQCYLSQYIGGRSANRGECAQPCRKKYSILNNNEKVIAKDIHALCLKDLNASKHLETMINNGIFSFKIEGRLKEAGYVKNITAYYRNELDKFSKKVSSGKAFYQFIPDPQRSFNRGFTDYFLEKRKDCFSFETPKSKGKYIGTVKKICKDYLVINSDVEIHAQDGLCFITKNELEGFLVNKVEQDRIYPNKKINLKEGQKIYRNQDIEFEKLLALPVKRQIGLNIKYKDGSLELTDEDSVSIKVKVKYIEPAKNPQKMNDTFIKQFCKTGESDFYIDNIEISSNLPFMPISEINELRRTSFEKLMEKRLASYQREKQKPLKYSDYFCSEIDYRANVHNSEARKFYEKCSCKTKETSIESNMPKEQVELMRTKHCIKYALNMCKSSKKLFLLDEKGIKYPLFFDCKNCEMAVLSPLPHCSA